jgi:hypothetical protein
MLLKFEIYTLRNLTTGSGLGLFGGETWIFTHSEEHGWQMIRQQRAEDNIWTQE